jgi:hypothetical protein
MPATKAKRNREILGAMRINQTLGELDEAAQDLTGSQATAVNRAYDSLAAELWDHTMGLVKKNLGPGQQKRLILVLNTVREVLDAERLKLYSKRSPTLRPVTPQEAQWFRELAQFEKLFLLRTKDIVRAIDEHNSTKRTRKTKQEKTETAPANV